MCIYVYIHSWLIVECVVYLATIWWDGEYFFRDIIKHGTCIMDEDVMWTNWGQVFHEDINLVYEGNVMRQTIFWKYSLIHHVSPFYVAIIFIFWFSAQNGGSLLLYNARLSNDWYKKKQNIVRVWHSSGVLAVWDICNGIKLRKKIVTQPFSCSTMGGFISRTPFSRNHILGFLGVIWRVLLPSVIYEIPNGPVKPIDHMSHVKPHNLGDQIPSGKRSHNYGTSPCSMGKSTINGHFQ